MDQKFTFKKNEISLIGRNIEINTFAPDFKVVSKDLKEACLDNFKGKIKVITTFLSLDTPVCDLQVKEFNKKVLDFNVEVLGISMDLPFAQSRFCSTFNIDHLTLLSDYKGASFGLNYGLFIKQLNLLARAVLILDSKNIIRYVQIAKEQTGSLDYEDVLKNLKEIVKNPVSKEVKETIKCLPCEGKENPLSLERATKLLKELKGWDLKDGKKIVKEFKFLNFLETKSFFDSIAAIAEIEGHHPTVTISYKTALVTLTTHSISGLSENDFVMAKILDNIKK
jgi:thioredoxin-dependent peroxiredoxin